MSASDNIHNILLNKWLKDDGLLLGPLFQPNESENSINCDCGGHYNPTNKHHHIKTKQHLKHLEIIKNTSDIMVSSKPYNKNRNVHAKGFTYDGQVIISEGNKAVYETCVRCGIEYPLTPNYFHTEYAQHKKSNINDRESGKELVSNSSFYGCRLCAKKIAEERSKTEAEIKRQKILRYSGNGSGDLTIEWIDQQLEKQNNRCHISNLPITLERDLYYTASVQNNGEGQIHYQANCVLIMQCLQVAEHSIKNLKDAWKQILLAMKKEKESPSDTTLFLNELDKKFSNTPEENGVTAPVQIYLNNIVITGSCGIIIKNTGKECGRDCINDNTVCSIHLSKDEREKINIKKKINPEYSSQMANLHLPSILRSQVENYYAQDKRSKSRPDKSNIIKMLPDDIVKKMHDQNGRCYYSDVQFSFERSDPNYWSLERLDNSKHHTFDNTVLICRIMNGSSQLSKDIIQQIYNSFEY